MFGFGKKNTRVYEGEPPRPETLELEIKVSLRKKKGTYEHETIGTSVIESMLPVNSDGKISDIKAAIETQVGQAFAQLENALENDPRLTDGAHKKFNEKENE